MGFWKILPGGEGRFRQNNTLDCEGRQLVVFRELPSPLLHWGVLPERWIDNGKVILQVAKGTLVPRVPMAALEPDLWRSGGRVSVSSNGVFIDGRGASTPLPPACKHTHALLSLSCPASPTRGVLLPVPRRARAPSRLLRATARPRPGTRARPSPRARARSNSFLARQ